MVTLKDVEVQFGLTVDGDVVIGSAHENWQNICMELLSHVPENNNDLKVVA